MSIRNLIMRLEQLPELRSQNDVLGTLGTYETKLGVAAKIAVRARASEGAVGNVFASVGAKPVQSDLTAVNERLASASKLAKREHKKLAERIDTVGSKETEKKVIAIQDYIEDADAKLRAKWQAFVNSFVEDYERLAAATEMAKLNGAPQLRLLLLSFAQRAQKPPQSQPEALSAIEEITGVRRTLSEMGIETEIGRFLVAVSNGTADPRELDKPEIRAFIEGANLWKLLHLKLA